jgi:cold shock CspA family protein
MEQAIPRLAHAMHHVEHMQVPVRITFKNLDPSPALEADVRERVDQLEKFYPRLTGCHVVIEAPHRHHRQGRHYHVHIDLTAPGAEIVAGRSPPEHGAHEDPYVAVRDAFRAARRELMDLARKQRGQTKLHEPPASGTVVYVSREGYGFIASDDGREIYFHANSVLDDFDTLDLGQRVRFVEESGDKGPQASTVERV